MMRSETGRNDISLVLAWIARIVWRRKLHDTHLIIHNTVIIYLNRCKYNNIFTIFYINTNRIGGGKLATFPENGIAFTIHILIGGEPDCMHKEMARYMMSYMLTHYFESKADMARKLDVDKRNLQRILNGSNYSKTGNSVFGKAMDYCEAHGISVRQIVDEFITEEESRLRDMTLLAQTPRTDCVCYERAMEINEEINKRSNSVLESYMYTAKALSVYICAKCKSQRGENRRNKRHTLDICYLMRISQCLHEVMDQLYRE